MKRSLVLASGLLLTAGAAAQELSFSITNLTKGIYFTPLLITAHEQDASLFNPGVAATSELQAIAEGGDIGPMVTLLQSVSAAVLEDPAAGLLAPGAQVEAQLSSGDRPLLSLAAMLLPTNDGFVGLSQWPIPTEAGSHTLYLNAYDAGTEANSELAASIPGPAGGGTGFDSSRDDDDRVAIHPGVISAADGLSGSALDASHRFDNPAAMVVLTRLP